jgi:S-adenosylmethionine synthetase
MTSQVSVTRVESDPVVSRRTEFVERKGLGHPDTLCDGVAEAISRALSQRYLDEFGRVLHHNTDSVQLVAGETAPGFGGGEIREAPTLYLGGQATRRVGDTTVPVEDIAETAAREYLDSTVELLPADRLTVVVDVNETSRELEALFERNEHVNANDTSVGVGYAPFSDTERIVRTLEPRVRQELAAVGEDVKVMGVRSDGTLHLTVAAAVIGRRVAGIEAYLDVVGSVRELAEEHARARTDLEIDVDVNTADDPDAGEVYLTETGLSAEAGDDGAVGRGNRTNGLITPHRSMSIEATAGKNPITHVGKLYNLLARRTAERTATDIDVDYAEVSLCSEIGSPITEPLAADVVTTAADTDAVANLVRDEISRIDALTERVLAGDVDLF